MGSPPTPQEAAPRTRSPHRPSALSPPQEREAIIYLKRELLPELQRAHRPDLAQGVQLAVQMGTLEPLHTLSPSQKHFLLGAIESRMGRRARARPSVVVRLVGCLDLTPPELLELGHRHPILPPR